MSEAKPTTCKWCGRDLGKHWATMPRHPDDGFHYECLPLTAEETRQLAQAPIVFDDEP